MTSTDIVIARPRNYAHTQPRVAAKPSRLETVLVAAASRAGEAKRTLGDSLHRVRHPAPRKRPARILAIIPAHNEGDRHWADPLRAAPIGATPIERTLESIQRQTRRPDRTVVIVNNSTDDTAARAKRFRWATVIVLHHNEDKKVGALNHAWQEWSAGYDFIAGIDADTEVEPECLAQLETEMVRRPQAAGIMARYTMRQSDATGPMSALLVRAQRLDFSSWVDESLAHRRDTYVLGGQATLFRRDALAKVRDDHHRVGPWDPNADVEDMELTWRVKENNRTALTSAEARAKSRNASSIRCISSTSARSAGTSSSSIIDSPSRNRVSGVRRSWLTPESSSVRCSICRSIRLRMSRKAFPAIRTSVAPVGL